MEVSDDCDVEFHHSLHQRMPQYVAAEEGHTDIVKYLVNSGASINNTDRTGVSYAMFPLSMLFLTS